MSKATRALGLLSALFVFWVAVLLNWIPLPLGKTIHDEIWPVLPFEFLVGLGAYLLGSVGYGLLVFRDCPEAYHELVQEIEMAKADLTQNKII
ncbi:hypothetical protein H4R33_001514 [Dimargaris cristalligena]|uniref:Dolichol-phosphate mannosyltransferase subunit 3 n=1 Tax=Dimargaris cristalligena TaxID=215637 RepID=A0A4Q0A3S4_9FUNG|nr:hypothetical protein H4R33_001514 [Dimargaris cristalligena]RKP39910.1 dolichol-phosphate mannosyltransferase subunit 3 [Dimargaris cristalligena]|eukprot:RKP39910.1 dolichol-phosphate mannosyltransferase subunit 3 [Dimargaris cristalligena]